MLCGLWAKREQIFYSRWDRWDSRLHSCPRASPPPRRPTASSCSTASSPPATAERRPVTSAPHANAVFVCWKSHQCVPLVPAWRNVFNISCFLHPVLMEGEIYLDVKMNSISSYFFFFNFQLRWCYVMKAIHRSNLVKVFPRKERLIIQFVEEDGESLGLGPLLPLRAGAVPQQGVVPHLVVVGVLTGQNAASAGAAQRRDSKLQEGDQSGNRGRQKRNRRGEMGKKKHIRRMIDARYTLRYSNNLHLL